MAVKLTKKGGFNRSNALTNLVNKDKLTPHLIKGTMEDFSWTYSYEPKGNDDAWHPSGDCVPSALELYHKATATEAEKAKAEEKWLGMNRTFQVGHFWHQYYQQIVQRIGFAEPSAIERRGVDWWGDLTPIDPIDIPDGWYVLEGTGTAAPYHWVTGSADVAPCVIPRAGEFVVDFKSMGNHDFKRKGMPQGFDKKYEAQINIYMDLFDLETGLIVGIQKDRPHDLKEFQFRRNQPLIDAIYNKWKYVTQCIDDGVAPEGPEPNLPFTGPVETT